MFVVMQDREKGGGGEKCLFSCQAKEHSPTFSVSNNNNNFADMKQLLSCFFLLVPSFFKKGKGLTTCMEVIKGMNTWPVCGNLNVMFIAISTGLRSVPDTWWLVIECSIS